MTTKKTAKKTAKKKTVKKAAKKVAKKTAKKVAKKTTKKKTTKKSAAKSSSGSGKNLLVVESPAKAKTIKRFLGRDFTIKASMGHVRDIPSKGRGRNAFGIDFDNGYKPTYEPIKGREKVLSELATAAKKADKIYLAPDPDREGEAIAWHVLEALKERMDVPDEKVERVTFNSITRAAVQEAISQPRKIDMNRVNAQQGRRVLDRLVGFSLSPFLWRKVTKGLSAGRVQSVAVRMVVEREKEIRAFTPEEFWRITAEMSPSDGSETNQHFLASLVEWDGQKFVLGQAIASNEENAKSVAAALEAAAFTVKSVDERETKGRPSPPFITSTLQQAASTYLRYNTSRTMRIAQQLYEGIETADGLTGLITYMRTDSTRIAPEALDAARTLIRDDFGEEYLPEKAQFYRSKKGAQDAHEAVRPTDIFLTPKRLKEHLSADQYKLYDLIWRRFMASQMKPAIYSTTTITIAAAKGILEGKGRRLLFDGHARLMFEQAKKKTKKEDTKETDKADEEEKQAKLPADDQTLPKVIAGDSLNLEELLPTQHFTQPPPRFSEASLVRALEKEGIGRPSTYAPIVKTIQDRGYVRQEQRRFFASELGIAVTEILMKHFPDIMELNFTAGMEEDLDHIEEGAVDWVDLIDRFYKPFQEKLELANENAESLKGKPAPNGEKCPECESDMVIRYSQRGAFLGCGKYPDCRGTRPLPGEEAGDNGEDEEEAPMCPACNVAMTRRRSRFGQFYGCPNYPTCKNTIPIGRDGKAVKPPEVKLDCEKCGTPMYVKASGRRFSIVCPNEECKNSKPLDKNGKVVILPEIKGEVCDKCGAEMVVRMSHRGPFMACSAYPKCRNTRPLPKDEKDEKDEKGKASEKETPPAPDKE